MRIIYEILHLWRKQSGAFSLLEALVRSGCPFLFKGGSSLLLHFDSSRRLSIDIDIICPPGTRIEDYLEKYSAEYGFGNVELVQRISRTDVPETTCQVFLWSVLSGRGKQDKNPVGCIVWGNPLCQCDRSTYQSRFLKQQGETSHGKTAQQGRLVRW